MSAVEGRAVRGHATGMATCAATGTGSVALARGEGTRAFGSSRGTTTPRSCVLATCLHGPTATVSRMPTIAPTMLANGLPLHRIGLDGTRAVTILAAFDAGARTERPEENGMAHFLEHLVFKGGEKYPHYRDVNDTAERLGGGPDAYTSPHLVAVHATAPRGAGVGRQA